MFGFGEQEEHHEQVYGQEEHEGHLSHEIIAGAASFAAMRSYEQKQREEGNPVSHAFAKEALAGLVGAEVDKLVETKGLDYIDREKAKHQAREVAESSYDSHYGEREEWHPDHEPPFDYANEKYNY